MFSSTHSKQNTRRVTEGVKTNNKRKSTKKRRHPRAPARNKRLEKNEGNKYLSTITMRESLKHGERKTCAQALAHRLGR